MFIYNNLICIYIYIPEQPKHFFPVITLHALDKLHLHCCACFTCGKHMEKQHVAWPPRLMASTQRKTDVGSWIFFRSVSVGPSCKMSIRKSEVSRNQYGLQHRSTIGNYRTCQPTQEDIINHLSWSAASAPTGAKPSYAAAARQGFDGPRQGELPFQDQVLWHPLITCVMVKPWSFN